MSVYHGTTRRHIMELLAGEAVGDLDEKELIELARLTRGLPHPIPDDLLRAAALTQLALLRQERRACRPLPAALKSRLQDLAADWVARQVPGSPESADS